MSADSDGVHVADRLLGVDGLGDALDRLAAVVRPERTVPGFATVDLDRGVRETVGARAAQAPLSVEDAHSDPILGASARLVRDGGGRTVVLLEPSTEGPLAASLARFGEGVVALYLVVRPAAVEAARAEGFVLSRQEPGPLGPERRVVVGPRWGPHLLLVVTDIGREPDTIGP